MHEVEVETFEGVGQRNLVFGPAGALPYRGPTGPSIRNPQCQPLDDPVPPGEHAGRPGSPHRKLLKGKCTGHRPTTACRRELLPDR